MELAPTTSMIERETPTRAYWAVILWAASGRKSDEMSPSEVESPRWATCLQLVRSGAVWTTVAAGWIRADATVAAIVVEGAL